MSTILILFCFLGLFNKPFTIDSEVSDCKATEEQRIETHLYNIDRGLFEIPSSICLQGMRKTIRNLYQMYWCLDLSSNPTPSKYTPIALFSFSESCCSSFPFDEYNFIRGSSLLKTDVLTYDNKQGVLGELAAYFPLIRHGAHRGHKELGTIHRQTHRHTVSHNSKPISQASFSSLKIMEVC
jgi:hypothetical protein